MRWDGWRRAGCLLASLVMFEAGCVRSYAMRTVANALSKSGGVYAVDDDPELVGDALPFALKTMESVLQEQPDHAGLLTALVSGFTQYTFGWVETKAQELADADIDRALALRRRAKKLYQRAQAYGMRGLEAGHPDFARTFGRDPATALRGMKKEDVPLLYWTAAAWGLAISASKDDPEVIADLPQVARLARRALDLDETWNRGSLHELFITLETSVPDGSVARAREHFSRAVALSKGLRAGPYVTLAEKVSVKEQKAREFHSLLDKALAINVEQSPEDRLANVLMQRRAVRLKKSSGDLFLEDIDEAGTRTSTRSAGSAGHGQEKVSWSR